MNSAQTLSGLQIVLFVSCFVVAPYAGAQSPAGKPTICLVTPDVQMGQGTDGQTNPSKLVLDSLASYLAGPAANVQPLQARIPVQFMAEAVQAGCSFVVESDVVLKKAGKGLSGLLAAAPALASAVPFMGGMGGSASSYAAAQVASAAAQGAASAQAQASQEDAMAAMSGAAQSNIKKGDHVTLVYKLYRPGNSTPIGGQELQAKAEESGQDVLSPLLEQAATDVLTVAMQGGG